MMKSVMITSLPCDLTANCNVQGQDDLTCCSVRLLRCISKRILEKIAVLHCCLVNKLLNTWFVQIRTYSFASEFLFIA